MIPRERYMPDPDQVREAMVACLGVMPEIVRATDEQLVRFALALRPPTAWARILSEHDVEAGP